MSFPAPRHSSIKTACLSLALVASIPLFLAATRIVSQRNSDILGVAEILVSSILGIAIARSMNRTSSSASMLGGAAGGAIVLGATFFFHVLLVPPEPGTIYKFGNGIGSAFAGLLGGLFLGGVSGGVDGLLAGLLRKIP